MKVLIIDDIETSVKGIIDSCDDKGWEVKCLGFNEASAAIMDFDPDIIVLDWREDVENIDIGGDILDKIWKITFRPIVLFTANASIIDVKDKSEKSNMLKVFSKGDETPVIKFLEEMEKFVSELSEFREKMSSALISSLNSIDNLKGVPDIEDSAVSYILSKRTSAFFDDQYISELSPSWVQYLCPPLSSCLNVCDIIRAKGTETDMESVGEPEEYLLILTPSCDMYYTDKRPPKVTHVLCVGCYSKDCFHKIGLVQEPSESNIKSVMAKLNLGYNGNFVALPGFSNIIPFMTADLRKTQLIDLAKIAPDKSSISEESEYVRIASICSPFREQIVWAYMQISCRPGVPDRNTKLWAKEILKK